MHPKATNRQLKSVPKALAKVRHCCSSFEFHGCTVIGIDNSKGELRQDHFNGFAGVAKILNLPKDYQHNLTL
jgi:hypothetical protein